MSQLQISIVGVAPVGGQALQRFFDIACFDCPPAATKTPPLLPILTTSATVPTGLSNTLLSIRPSTSGASVSGSPSVEACTFQNAVLAINDVGLGFGHYVHLSNPDGDFTTVDFGDLNSASQFNLNADGTLTTLVSQNLVKTANVPRSATNTDLQFNAPDSIGAPSRCTVVNDEVTCVTGENVLLYVCQGEPGLMTGPFVPAPILTSMPPRICAAVTFEVQAPDGTPLNVCLG